jgi:hypothetical protein
MKRGATLREVTQMPTPRKYATDAQRYAAYRQRKKEARLTEQQAKGLPLLPAIPTMPGTKRWRAIEDLAIELLSTARNEMESYRDERSQSWQEGENGQAHQEWLDRIEARLDP